MLSIQTISKEVTHFILQFVFLTLFFTSCAIRSENSSFLDQLYDISGVSKTPSPTRGSFRELSGEIWVKELAQGKAINVTKSGEFQSPIYLPDDTDLLALQDNNVVLISGETGKPKTLFSIPNIIKLVGFDKTNPDRFLILVEEDDLSVLLVTLDSGLRTPLKVSSNEEVDTMISHLWGWHRVYDNIEVFEKSYNKKDRRGRIYEAERNVYILENGKKINVSQCGQRKCGQPSLSFDKTSVVFIKESAAD